MAEQDDVIRIFDKGVNHYIEMVLTKGGAAFHLLLFASLHAANCSLMCVCHELQSIWICTMI